MLAQLAIFFELFAGAASLSAAVQDLASSAHVVSAADAWRDADQDLLQDDFLHHCVGMARKAYWLHQAPPCRTFTRARRSDKWAKVKVLRTDERPEGFGAPETEQANELARRAVFLARCVMEGGGYFSIENPLDSRLWDMPFVRALAKLEGVRFVRWDACMSGSRHKKSTGFLTNAPWIQDVICDRIRFPHIHVPLEGRVRDYRPGAETEEVWYTSLAAEYCEGLCNKLARDFQQHLEMNGVEKQEGRKDARAKEVAYDPLLEDLERQARGVWEARPKLGKKAELLTKKQVTERENASCCGGLRDPAGYVRNSDRARNLGFRLRSALERALRVPEVRRAMDQVINDLGTEKCRCPFAEVDVAREVLCEAFGIEVDKDIGKGESSDTRSRYFANLWEKLLQESGDPEQDLPTWMRHGAPVGWNGSLTPNGVFPEVENDTAAVEKSRQFEGAGVDSAFWAPHSCSPNYRSFYDAGSHAETEVQRIHEAGFVEEFETLEELKEKHGQDVVVNKLGCVLKVKISGEVKARLVTDLRRSGGNGRLKIRERVVLPRVIDLVASILRLLERWGTEEKVDLAAIDFTDAFHTIWLDERERPLCVFESSGKWYVYKRLPFGLASAPLVWGRLAAAAFRLTQALAVRSEFESHCYVDDPGFALAGASRWSRRKTFSLVLLFLMCLGMDVSWMKAQYGKIIEWLGVTIELTTRDGRPGVVVTIPASKCTDIISEIDEILTDGAMTHEKKLRRVAGRVSWIAGIIPWAKAFAAILHAAAHEDSGVSSARTRRRRAKRPEHLRFVTKPAGQALSWTRTLLQGSLRDGSGALLPLTRVFTVRNWEGSSQMVLRCDASPWGFGGLLEMNGKAVSYWADEVTDLDRRVCPGQAGDPSFQAEWELYAILISIAVWQGRMAGAHVACLQTDSKAALFACAKLSSNTPTMNSIAAEIALRVVGLQIELGHVAGVANYEADALSRLCQGKAVPAHLAEVERATAPVRNADFFLAWSRDFAVSQG